MNDSEFDDLLRTARTDVALPSSFRQGVWHRIEVASATGSPGRWTRLFGDVFLRPAGALSSIAATVAVGMWLGATGGSNPEEAKVSYVNSVSPFAQAHTK